VFTLYPSIGELVMVWSPDRPPVEQSGLVEDSRWSLLGEDVRADLNAQRSYCRAAVSLRRFIEHNRLVKMWTLTNADEVHDLSEFRGRIQSAIRRIRRDFFRGKPFPYAYVIEPHPNGHGLHCHLFLQNVFIQHAQFARAWGHGYVHYRNFCSAGGTDFLGRPLGGRSGASARYGARAAARYAAKYGGKTLDEVAGFNGHRYEVSKGFQPPRQRIRVSNFATGLHRLRQHPSFGQLDYEWHSADMADWAGPPVQIYRYTPPPRAPRGRRRAGHRIIDPETGEIIYVT
jgi:hypothetical protein